jgi:hypothetical protein
MGKNNNKIEIEEMPVCVCVKEGKCENNIDFKQCGRCDMVC